jgi:hypothetical protein
MAVGCALEQKWTLASGLMALTLIAHLTVVASGERGKLFDWNGPTVFVKVGN